MSLRRAVAFPALLAVTASCATLTHYEPVAPRAGPKASLHASYTGDFMYRRLEASFSVDRAAYVLVGHLGGDGRIRVLYPSSAAERGLVPGGKLVRARAADARWDAMPMLFSYATSTVRNVGSQIDSYDGSGHSYLFIIASRAPLNFAAISERGVFDEIDVRDYYNSFDVRWSIRDFADMVADGAAYTLEFANNFTTIAFGLSQFGSRCSSLNTWSPIALSMLDFWTYYNWPSYSLGFAPYGSPYRPSCLRNAYRYYGGYAFGSYGPRFGPAPAPEIPQTPIGGKKVPSFGRPGTRRPDEAGRAFSFTRPMSTRPTQTTYNGFPTSGERPRPFTRSFTRPSDDFFNGHGRPISGRSRDYTPTYTPSTPVHETPRFDTPRSMPVERAPAAAPAPQPAPRPVAAPSSERPVSPRAEERKP